MSRVRLDRFDPRKGLDRGRSAGVEIFWYLIKVTFFLSAWPWPSAWKVALLRFFGARIGQGVVIKPRINIHLPWKLAIGDHCWLGEELFILNMELVEIGNHVCLSQRVFLCTGNHDYRREDFAYRNAPIVIADGAWVGAQSFIGPGVTVGSEAVVQAGSIVSKSLAPSKIYGGNPATEMADRWKPA